MNLYYDNIVYSLQKIGGISSYWYELTNRFLENKAVKMNFFETDVESDNILRQKLDLDPDQLVIKKRGMLLVERFCRLETFKIQDSIFHSSYFRVPGKDSKIKKVCTVHDFTHDLYFKGARAWLHNIPKSRAILESDAIITVSENTKTDLLKFYPKTDESKIHVIYNGVSDIFRKVDLDLDKEKPGLLYVGARDDYKNFKFAVSVAKALTDFHFNIVGGTLTNIEKGFLDLHIKDRYTVHTNIATDELNLLYNRSVCLLYPSSYEGFGIPLLEAMRAGCPFIALNTSSIPEVAGDAGILLSKLDLEEAIEAVQLIANSRAEFIRKGNIQSAKFSWDRCYNETYKLYQKLL